MGLDADSFDQRSLSSIHSQQSIQSLRMQALRKQQSHEHSDSQSSAHAKFDGINRP